MNVALSSKRTPTSPAGGRNVETAAPSFRSSQAVPTSGCPANGSSVAGVKICSSPVSRLSTKTVSL